MDKLPMSLIMFFSTKGHGEFRNSYKDTIEDLEKNISLDVFPLKLANVKYPSKEKGFAEEMDNWLENKGFKVLLHQGEWKDDNNSKHREYLSDVIKVLLDNELNSLPFTYWNEGDVVIRPRIDKLINFLEKGMQLLVENQDILKVGISDRLDEFDRINGVKAKHGLDREAVKIKNIDSFYLHNDLFNFRVSICRQRDLFHAARILVHNFNRLSYHCEMGFSDAIKMLSDAKHMFIDFEPKLIQHIHGENKEFSYNR